MRKAFFQLHLAVFLAGFTGIFGKLITLGEGWLVGWRMLITAVSLGLLFLPGHRLQRLPPRLVASLLGIGGIVALHWLFFYGSIKYANTSVALTCFSATGFFTAFAEPLLTRQRIQWGDVWLGAMTILGIYIIFDFHPQYKTGILLGLAAALGSALFPVFNKQLVGKVQPRTLTFYEMCGGVLLLALLLPFYGQSFVWPSASDWGWLLVLSWVCTILCFELQLKALRHISAFTANLSYNLEPLYGILLAFALFGEGRQLNGGFYVGLALIVGAVVLQTKKLVKGEVG